MMWDRTELSSRLLDFGQKACDRWLGLTSCVNCGEDYARHLAKAAAEEIGVLEAKSHDPEWLLPALVQHLRGLGCACPQPLVGYSPGFGPRCRLCNVDAETAANQK
jgi:hypothetical protein